MSEADVVDDPRRAKTLGIAELSAIGNGHELDVLPINLDQGLGQFADDRRVAPVLFALTQPDGHGQLRWAVKLGQGSGIGLVFSAHPQFLKARGVGKTHV